VNQLHNRGAINVTSQRLVTRIRKIRIISIQFKHVFVNRNNKSEYDNIRLHATAIEKLCHDTVAKCKPGRYLIQQKA
jgi:hypothetical protein